jgi:hypothetical protein
MLGRLYISLSSKSDRLELKLRRDLRHITVRALTDPPTITSSTPEPIEPLTEFLQRSDSTLESYWFAKFEPIMQGNGASCHILNRSNEGPVMSLGSEGGKLAVFRAVERFGR